MGTMVFEQSLKQLPFIVFSMLLLGAGWVVLFKIREGYLFRDWEDHLIYLLGLTPIVIMSYYAPFALFTIFGDIYFIREKISLRLFYQLSFLSAFLGIAAYNDVQKNKQKKCQ
jgi:hypothetical protein